MNERIKELAEQTGYDWQWDTQIDFGHKEMEKFAAMIVAECGYYADVFEAVGCPVDMDPTETKPSDYIKKQLGIENEQV